MVIQLCDYAKNNNTELYNVKSMNYMMHELYLNLIIFLKPPFHQIQPKEGDPEKGGKQLAGEEITSFLEKDPKKKCFFLIQEI